MTVEPPADEPAQQQDIQPPSHRRRRKTWPVIAVVIATAIAIAVAVTIFIQGGVSGTEDQEAKDACEKFVGELLTSPSSAEYTHTYTNLAGGNWTVKGNVEAADSFGVMLRSEFRCVVNGETWELVLLRIDE